MMKNKEYYDELSNRFLNGGTIWVIERTDTNQFMSINFEYNSKNTNKHTWSNNLGFSEIIVGYLTKEDAEKDNGFFHPTGGECPCCGNGSTPIPFEIREHEFVAQK